MIRSSVPVSLSLSLSLPEPGTKRALLKLRPPSLCPGSATWEDKYFRLHVQQRPRSAARAELCDRCQPWNRTCSDPASSASYGSRLQPIKVKVAHGMCGTFKDKRPSCSRSVTDGGRPGLDTGLFAGELRPRVTHFFTEPRILLCPPGNGSRSGRVCRNSQAKCYCEAVTFNN